MSFMSQQESPPPPQGPKSRPQPSLEPPSLSDNGTPRESSVASVADPFPIDALPPILRQIAEAVADAAAVPHALPGCCVLGTVSAALGAGLAIPSEREQHTFGNLYVIAAAESGGGKSVTFGKILAPVYEYQDALRSTAQAGHYQLKAELFNLQGTLREAKSRKALIEPDELATLIQRKDYIEAALKTRPKIICEDVTPERMQVLLAENNERVFSASADARHMSQAVMRSRGDNPYLKGWSGDPTDVDRISRSAVPLRAPRITLLWLPQPDLMTEMFASRVLTANGFLPRVLPCLVEYTPMPIENRTRRVAAETEQEWRQLVFSLFENYHAKEGSPFTLKRSGDVRTLMIRYYNSIIKRRQGDLADVGPYAARWAEQAWRLAVVLQAGLYGRRAHNLSVTEGTAECAIRLMDWFSHQQLELLGRTRAHAKTEVQQAVFEMLALGKEVTVRDVQRGALRSLSAAEARHVLDQLVAAGKLHCRSEAPGRGGHEVKFYSRPLGQL